MQILPVSWLGSQKSSVLGLEFPLSETASWGFLMLYSSFESALIDHLLWRGVSVLIAPHRWHAHEAIHAGGVPPPKCPCCGQDGTGAASGKQAQPHPLCGPQAIQQAPPPVAQSALQCWPPSQRLPWLRKEDAKASRAAPAPWSLLRVRERQRLGGQQDQSDGHIRQRGHGAAKRQHQQREQEAVLLRDHVSQCHTLGRLRLFGDRCEALELQLHQLTHVCARSDVLQKPGGVEAHTHQRCLCVRAEPQVLAAVRTTQSPSRPHTEKGWNPVHTLTLPARRNLLILGVGVCMYELQDLYELLKSSKSEYPTFLEEYKEPGSADCSGFSQNQSRQFQLANRCF